MSDTTHVVAGRCTTVASGTRETEHRGEMLVVCKRDGTVLVHDAEGYQPLAWLTRAESVTHTADTIAATDGDQTLRVTVEESRLIEAVPAGSTGVPVGTCPECADDLVRSGGAVTCLGCDRHHSFPRDATLLEDTCADCGLPQFRARRGASFVVCLDRTCESFDDRVRKAFDRQWDCPDCDGDLRVLRRGGLLLGCERYPECETGFAFPNGVHDGDCECGLPSFEVGGDSRCLDSSCLQARPEHA